ncbi:TPA: hypothetical protein MW242_002895 [Acinetobacter baumannii]|nr:hypothetical protein [Acinetobacter baumannii]
MRLIDNSFEKNVFFVLIAPLLTILIVVWSVGYFFPNFTKSIRDRVAPNEVINTPVSAALQFTAEKLANVATTDLGGGKVLVEVAYHNGFHCFVKVQPSIKNQTTTYVVYEHQCTQNNQTY